MKKILLISPHFDDAVLSAGQYMADRADAEVVTVFGGYPDTPERVHTPYDEKCGFKDARDAITMRKIENDNALALLAATSINLDFCDSQYYNEYTPQSTSDQIAEQLQKILDKTDYEFIMGPLGLGHPDHIKVTDAIIKLKTNKAIYLWEDLPLRVVEPELVRDRLETLRLDKWTQHSTTGDKMANKIRAMLCYRSQINTGILDPYVMYVPERFWTYEA